MADTPAKLDYAARPAWHRRKWGRRALIGMVVLIIAIGTDIGVQRLLSIIERNLAIAALHEKCLTYSMPKGIAYEEGDLYRIYNLSTTSGPATNVTPLLPDAVRIAAYEGGIFGIRPQLLSNLPPLVKGTTSLPNSFTVFLHGRRARGGPLRVVSVEMNPNRPVGRALQSGHNPSAIRARVIKPASLFSPGAEFRAEYPTPLEHLDNHAFGIVLLGGQPDPADESHFTIELQGEGTIHGWLQPDDTVKLEYRPHPIQNSGNLNMSQQR
jgi:hypothetical protein